MSPKNLEVSGGDEVACYVAFSTRTLPGIRIRLAIQMKVMCLKVEDKECNAIWILCVTGGEYLGFTQETRKGIRVD